MVVAETLSWRRDPGPNRLSVSVQATATRLEPRASRRKVEHQYSSSACRLLVYSSKLQIAYPRHVYRVTTAPNAAMAVDPLSPIAPARIRALLLPIGRIKRSRFLAYVDLLQQQSLVRLGDISPDPRPDRSTSP